MSGLATYHGGMTIRFAPCCVAAVLLAAAGCGRDAPGPVQVTYRITGMHCGGCAEAIVAEVSEVKGVRGVRCTYESGTATLDLEDQAARAEAERAITKLGYAISPQAPGASAGAQPPASR